MLSEGRSKGQELGESFLPLQKRYTAPLMELLARGQARGEIRADMPLRLLRSLVLGPKLVLADEPTGNLDRENAEHVLTLLRERVRASGAAAILVTHSEHAAASADRVYRLAHDGLIRNGSTAA